MQVDAPPAPRPLRMKKKSKNAPPADATPQAAGAPVQAPPAAETRTPAYKHVDGVRLDLRLRMKTRPPSTQEDIGAVRRFPGPPPGDQPPAGLTAQQGSIGAKFTRTTALGVTDVEFDLAPPGLIPGNTRSLDLADAKAAPPAPPLAPLGDVGIGCGTTRSHATWCATPGRHPPAARAPEVTAPTRLVRFSAQPR